MDELLDFKGKVALVTGGSRGLGREMTLALAERGANVVIASRKAEVCEAVAEEARALGVEALPYACHVGHWDQLGELADAAYERFGKVDILINNAGMSPLYPSLGDDGSGGEALTIGATHPTPSGVSVDPVPSPDLGEGRSSLGEATTELEADDLVAGSDVNAANSGVAGESLAEPSGPTSPPPKSEVTADQTSKEIHAEDDAASVAEDHEKASPPLWTLKHQTLVFREKT